MGREASLPRRACGPAAILAALLPAVANGDTPPPVDADADGLSAACREMFEWIVVERVGFHQASTDLKGASHALLSRLAEFTVDCPTARLRITGHTDAEGDPDYNLALSEQRAAAVAEYLAGLGVARERLVVVGAGASQPVADNGTAYGRERNRRIDIELLPPD
ncbi:MAG TPA: OmpA family protein [Woeseiaceae bacterium]|nr:OmpA family protein [Woeseiaceae bacterium]